MKNPLLRVFLYVLGLLSAFLNCEISNSQDAGLQPKSTAYSQIEYSSHFDCGSIDTLDISGNYLSGKTVHWEMADKIGNQYYWFYFKLDNVLNKKVTVKLTDLIGNYRGKAMTVYDNRTQPVYSYDQIYWERVSKAHYDKKMHTFVFTQKFTSNRVWIAYAHPYPYNRETEFINSLRSKSNITITKLGITRESREINLLTITDSTIDCPGKKVVLITAMQHAGEYPGGFIIEGLVNFLLSNDPVAVKARQENIFKIVPMMNPDGVFHGMTRYNSNYEDLNVEWDDDTTDTTHAPVEPEVACIKKWLRDWIRQGKTINIHIDLHSQSQQGDANVMHVPKDGMLRGFCAKLNKYFQIIYIPMEFYGSATYALDAEFNLPTTVFEILQSGIRGKPYFTIDDYEAYGEGIVKAVLDYFQAGGEGK